MVSAQRRGVGLSPFELHKLEQEKRQNRAEADTAAVYEDFVKAFEVDEAEEEAKRATKGKISFVKGGTAFANADEDDDEVESAPRKKELYLPPPSTRRTSTSAPARRRPLNLSDDEDEEKQSISASKGTKKKNIDALMEDIKKQQEERNRIGVKELPPGSGTERKGSFDAGDPTTTNIFVGNLSPNVKEESLMRLFGKYGPIASMKIMWPRTEEEHARGHISGFVAFMERSDAEAAHDALRRHNLDGRDLRLAWGRAVARPATPLAPLEGLEYGGSACRVFEPDDAMSRGDLQKRSVWICIPLDLARRREINVLAAFVAREGYLFELAVTEREKSAGASGRFKFLYDPKEWSSSEGQYYRWRVYSLLQGDKDLQWRTAPYAVTSGGRMIYPPTCGKPIHNPKVEGEVEAGRDIPKKDNKNDGDVSSMDNQLKDDDVEKLMEILRRATCAGDIVSIIAESLTLAETAINLKIARLFLVSDILHNSSVAQVKNCWVFRSRFQLVLEEVFSSLGVAYRGIDGRLTANAMRSQVERVLGAWERWLLYPQEILEKYRRLFTGETIYGENDASGLKVKRDPRVAEDQEEEEDMDGVPIDEEGEKEEDIDGEELDGEPLDIDGGEIDGEEDLDGEPL